MAAKIKAQGGKIWNTAVYKSERHFYNHADYNAQHGTKDNKVDYVKIKEQVRKYPSDLYFFPSREYHIGSMTTKAQLSEMYDANGQLKGFPKKGDNIYLKVEVFCKSLGGRNVYLMTITDDDVLKKKLGPNYNETSGSSSTLKNQAAIDATLKCKPVSFLSARVHPGETPGQFAQLGMIQFLLSEDPR